MWVLGANLKDVESDGEESRLVATAPLGFLHERKQHVPASLFFLVLLCHLNAILRILVEGIYE